MIRNAGHLPWLDIVQHLAIRVPLFLPSIGSYLTIQGPLCPCPTLFRTSLSKGSCPCQELGRTSLSKASCLAWKKTSGGDAFGPEALHPRIGVKAALREAKTSAPGVLPPRKGLLRRPLPLLAIGRYFTIRGSLRSPCIGSYLTVQGPPPLRGIGVRLNYPRASAHVSHWIVLDYSTASALCGH